MKQMKPAKTSNKETSTYISNLPVAHLPSKPHWAPHNCRWAVLGGNPTSSAGNIWQYIASSHWPWKQGIVSKHSGTGRKVEYQPERKWYTEFARIRAQKTNLRYKTYKSRIFSSHNLWGECHVACAFANPETVTKCCSNGKPYFKTSFSGDDRLVCFLPAQNESRLHACNNHPEKLLLQLFFSRCICAKHIYIYIV